MNQAMISIPPLLLVQRRSSRLKELLASLIDLVISSTIDKVTE